MSRFTPSITVDPGGMSSPGYDNCDLTWNDCVMTLHGWVCKPKS
jgi:hypothetical protein